METGKSKNEHDIEYLEKNSTLIGTKPLHLVDPETGQVLEMLQTTKLRYGSKPFWKCYLKDFLAAMDTLTGRQFDIFIYIVRNTKQSDNKFIGTYDKISKDMKCGRKVISQTVKSLQDCDFIRRVQSGVWMVNPNILMKGDGQKQVMLSKEYDRIQFEAEEKKKEKEEKKKKKEKKDDSSGQEQGKEVSAENNEESSEENHRNTNDTDDSDWDTDLDESSLPGHSGEKKQGEEVNEKNNGETST